VKRPNSSMNSQTISGDVDMSEFFLYLSLYCFTLYLLLGFLKIGTDWDNE